MKEIEVKARMKNKEAVLKKLQELGCILSEPVRQADTVYAKVVGTIEQYLTNEYYLRIREKSDGKVIFNIKKPLSKTVLTKMEQETEVKNAKELETILFAMGYQAASKVVKHRRTGHFGQFEICIDEVEKLGSFIEVEKMSDADADMVRKELNEFLASLGVSLDDQVHKGYDIMEIESRL